MIDLPTTFSFDSRGLLTFYSTAFHLNSQYEVQREVTPERGLQTNKNKLTQTEQQHIVDAYPLCVVLGFMQWRHVIAY